MDPMLDQMIDAQQNRQAAPPKLSLGEIVRQLLYPKPQAPINQPLPQFDAAGNPVDPRNLGDLRRR